MTSTMSKRSCPVRQLSLQQDIHGSKSKRAGALQKQRSYDSGGGGINSNHLKLQISNTRFGRSLTPDVKQSRSKPKVNPIHQTKPKPIKLAWSEKKSISFSNESEEGKEDVKVEVIAKKCKEIPRPFTAKPKMEVETKNTILYTKEELADRLKLAIKERQSRKQNLDIFLAQSVNNQNDNNRLTSMFQTNLQDLSYGQQRSDVHGFELNHSSVLGLQNESTSFVPYDDIVKDGHRFGIATLLKPLYSSKQIGEIGQKNHTRTIENNFCESCVQNCPTGENPNKKLEASEDNDSFFLMASSPCVHKKEEHAPKDVLKFKEILNIEKQRPFSVRVINDRIDIFNDDEDNDSLLLIESDDNEDGDSLSSSVDVEDVVNTEFPADSGKVSTEKLDLNPIETKPSRVPASERRNMFKNSGGRHKNNHVTQTVKAVDGLVSKRSRLIRMSSAPGANVNKAVLKKQTTINNSQEYAAKIRSEEKRDEQNLVRDLVIPTISITDDSETDLFRNIGNERSSNKMKGDGIQNNTAHDKENGNKYSDPSRLVLRKQNSVIHFSSDSENGKSLERNNLPNDMRRDRDSKYENQRHIFETVVKSPCVVSQGGNETTETSAIFSDDNDKKSDPSTLPLLNNKFTLQRQNSKPNKISFQSTLSSYMKNETNLIKPILTNNYDTERPDRIKSAMMLTNKKKLKFSKKKFHKSLDDVNSEQGVDSKKLTRIPLGRDVVTMVSLLSDESDVECDTPEPCNMVLHHASTSNAMSQSAEDGQIKHSLPPAPPVSTFQVCLRKPVDKPVALPVQTSSSGRSYSTLYPSRRGPGFDASSSSTNSMASFPIQSSSSVPQPQVSAAFKRKQSRVKSAPLCSSSKQTTEPGKLYTDSTVSQTPPTIKSNEMPPETPLPDTMNAQPTVSEQDPKQTPNLNVVISLPNTNSDKNECLKDLSPYDIGDASNDNDRSKENGTSSDTSNEEVQNNVNNNVTEMDNIDADKPPIFNTSKEQDCWNMYQKMTKKGINVSYDTILRGMLTPTEYRLHKKCNAAAMEREDSLGDKITVN